MLGSARAALKRAYLGLPVGARGAAKRIVYGETTLQQGLNDRARALLPERPAAGVGDLLVGGAHAPRRAVVVDHYDAWAQLEELTGRVTSVLADQGVTSYVLPGQREPLVVIADRDWPAAWRALSESTSLATVWATTHPGRHGRPFPVLHEGPAAPEILVYQNLVSAEGHRVAGPAWGVRLERWRTVAAENEPRPDGGFLAPGTLVPAGHRNAFAEYLSPDAQSALLAGERDDFVGAGAVTEPIDIVYTWVDGADPAWAEKRAFWAGEKSEITFDAALASRFESHDELRHSLRSVEMYASWCRHIYLVTDGQTPSWLAEDHPKLTVIDHRDLFPPEELPVFNSHAIESRIHQIPGLSERFVYLNDDMFFGGPVAPEVFFTAAGLTRYFPSPAVIDPAPRGEADQSVTSAAKNNREFLRRLTGRTITNKMKHTPYAHRRSVLEELEGRAPEVFAASRTRFREHGNYSLLSALGQYYGSLTGRAVEGRIGYGYVDISRPDIDQVLSKYVRTRRREVFCLNDGAKFPMTEAKQEAVASFLAAYFPLKSSFER